MIRAARSPLPVLLVALAWAPTALANPMDITLSRFVTEPACGQPGGVSVGGDTEHCDYFTDHQAFRDISRELGFAMAPFILAPPETLGYSGFYMGVEGQVTLINKDEDFWINGTEEKKPSSALFLSAVHVRKGLPASFELGTTLGYMAATEMVIVGLDLKFSVFEGFRKKVGGAFPDMALRAAVNQLIGEDELNLTVVGLDAAISWPITILQQATLTPYAGYQHVWIITDAEVVDGSPGRNFVVECHDPIENLCDGNTALPGNVEDSNNMLDFERQQVHMAKVFFGMRFIYEILAISAQYAFGIPVNKQDKDRDAPIQHQITFGVGTDF